MIKFKQMTKNNETIGGKPNLKKYRDTNGHWTVGYGHKIIPGENLDEITPEIAERLFEKDYLMAENRAAKLVGAQYDALSIEQQAALNDMAFQMGSFNFPKMMLALRRGDMETTKKEMLDSKWAKVDSPNRALRIAQLFNPS